MSLKILVVYHKKDILFKNDVLIPIQVGRELFMKNPENSQDDKEWFEKNMIGDNTGDNISSQNPRYNELTALYWAWKNYKQLGNPDYIGLFHYRRHLIFEERKSAFFECNHYDNNNYLSDQLKFDANKIEKDLKTKYDFIVSKPYYIDSVYSQYKNTHNIKELDKVIEIIRNHFPEYSTASDEYLNGKIAYYCNMFIMPREMFFEYCSFIFPVLHEFVNDSNFNGRLFVSERLTGIFVTKMMDEGKRTEYLPTMYLEEETKIPVVFASDRNYLEPTATTIVSMLQNSKRSTFYKIYLLTNINDAEFSEKYLKEICDVYPNCSLSIIPVNFKQEIDIQIKHTAVPTFYRLYIPKLLPEVSKCLYLDGDIIVRKDLSELYRLNIQDEYAAGVQAAGYYYPDEWKNKHSAEIGIPIEDYVNAGVLLLNLDKIRKDRIDEKFIELLKKNFSSQDQDILNVAFHNHIRLLDLQWNAMIKYIRADKDKVFIDKNAANVFGREEMKFADICIIHYADKVKPWAGQCILRNEWLRYNDAVQQIKMKNGISVIIPVYNMEKYLRECLDSVVSQTMKNIEIICINDGSTDNSLSILKEYAAKDSRFVIIDQKNKGVAAARNIGMSASTSEFVCFIDPDDVYPSKEVLKKLYSAAKTHNLKIAGGSWSEIDEKGNIKSDFSGRYSKYTFNKEGPIKFSDYQFDYGYQRFIFDRKMLFTNAITFPPYSRFQDPPFFIKAMACAGTFYAITDQTYRYRYGHQHIDWNDKKIRDLLLGIIDNLRMSSRMGLGELHRLNLDRVNHEYANRIVNRIENRKSDPYLFELLIRANTEVDRPLMKKIIPGFKENFVLAPIQRLIKHYKRSYWDNFKIRVKGKINHIVKHMRRRN